MDYFYKLSFSDGEGNVREMYYCDEFPYSFIRNEYENFGIIAFPTTDGLYIAESLLDCIAEVVFNQEPVPAEWGKCRDDVSKQMSSLSKVGSYLKMSINGGRLEVRVVARPEIDVPECIKIFGWQPWDLKSIFVNNKCLLQEGRKYGNDWHFEHPDERLWKAFCSLLRYTYEGVFDADVEYDYTADAVFIRVTITAESMDVIKKVLEHEFGCDTEGADLVPDAEFGDGAGEPHSVKYTVSLSDKRYNE